MNIILDIVLLVFIPASAWWLSGFDTNLSGDNTKKDFIRRSIRCGFTLLLLLPFAVLPGTMEGFVMMLILGAMLLLTWGWCLTEFISRGFHTLIGMTGSSREYDPHENTREMDRLADLLRNGKREEALQLAETLKLSNSANILALETLLERAGIPQENFKKTTPLAEASRFQREGKFIEAEAVLKSLLKENPSNVDAALMLMRIYVQDLGRSDKATDVLRAIEKQPHISSAHIEYASRSIQEWGRKKEAPMIEILPESVEGLIESGYLGTAIERVERTAQEQPDNFEAQLKVAEIYGRYAGDAHRAEKIVKKIGGNPAFNEVQIQLAHARLREWCEPKPGGK